MGDVHLGPVLGALATVVFAVGVINAIDGIDGIDGIESLAEPLLLIDFLSLAFVAVGGGEFTISKALFICSGTLAAFLCFNALVFVHSAEVFMSDGGSMMLGFDLLLFFARLTQEPVTAHSPIAAGRSLLGQSSFHQNLMDTGGHDNELRTLRPSPGSSAGVVASGMAARRASGLHHQ